MASLPDRANKQISQAERTTKPQHNPEFYARIGKKGGVRVLSERGYEWFATLGRKGGKVLRERNGPEYFRMLGRRGGLARRKHLAPSRAVRGG